MAKILIIEDSRLMRTIMREPLEANGYQILEAQNGKEGLAIYEEHDPDCIVLDLKLPIMDGHEVLRHLRASGSDVPVIVATSDVQDTTRELCNEVGVSTFLTKPFEGIALVACVNMGIAMRGTDLLSSQHSSRSVNILVVDDSQVMRQVIIHAISSEPWEIREASGGAQALEMIQQCKPDIVLLDQQMPGLRGNDILKILKSSDSTRDISVVIVTGESKDEMVKEALSLGAAEFISKPFSETVLVSRIQNVIRTRSLLLEQRMLREAADSASRAKSRFLANMSHEIRTPMTAILGFADLLLDTASDPRSIEGLQTIQRNGHYLLEIINDILDIAKIESGKLDLEQIECSPAQVLSDVVSLMEVRASDKNQALEIEFDGPIPHTIRSDPTRLRQILINLVSNAIKFSETGTIRLVTRTLDASSSDPKLQIDVVDSGIGMTDAQQSKLFQPFVQADASTTRKFGGTGLGLTISKRLAELLGGDLDVTSSLGKGSCFSVSLSTGTLDDVRWMDDPTEAESLDNSDSKQASSDVRLDCRVLLAEDGPDNQRLISFVLKANGAIVTVAENGQIAFDLAMAARDDGSPFNVILMDMQMPVLDGYEAAAKLRKAGYTLPIIALTAHAMASDRAKCMDAGCDDYTTKPIDRKHLIALVDQYASQRPVDEVTEMAEMLE